MNQPVYVVSCKIYVPTTMGQADQNSSARPLEESADAIGRTCATPFRLVDRSSCSVLVVVHLVYYNSLEQSVDCDK
jgi:hypothetical protein